MDDAATLELQELLKGALAFPTGRLRALAPRTPIAWRLRALRSDHMPLAAAGVQEEALMGKLVEHEVDVVALRSFRPKDYADVGCSQEDSALITQAIRANPSPAAKPTVDLPVGTENADVPQPAGSELQLRSDIRDMIGRATSAPAFP